MLKDGFNKKNFAICWDGLKSSVGVTIGKIEKSELLSNQQETVLLQVPQRLIRKASQNVYNNVEECAKPAHKKEYPDEFID